MDGLYLSGGQWISIIILRVFTVYALHCEIKQDSNLLVELLRNRSRELFRRKIESTRPLPTSLQC